MKKRMISTVVLAVLFFNFMFPENIIYAKSSFPWEDLKGKTVILHTNDIHGRVQPGINDSLGLPAVAAVKEACIRAGAKTIVLDCGDLIRGTAFALYDKGQSIITMMNLIGYDAMVTGNHDYEYGIQYLRELNQNMEFPILAANVLDIVNNQKIFESHIIIERNGVTFGIFGITTQAIMTINREENVRGIQVIDPILTARLEVEALKSRKVDVIIAIAHLGIKFREDPNCIDLLSQVEGIDLLIDGHSHSTLAECQRANPSSKTVYCSAGQYLNQIGAVIIDENRTITAYSLGIDDIRNSNIPAELLTSELQKKLQDVIQNVEQGLIYSYNSKKWE